LRLALPSSSLLEINSMAAGGACPPIIDLNRTLVGGETSSKHSNASQALGYFKKVEMHPFTLSHYWLKIKDFSKWKMERKLQSLV
jgi:hypothetical protein